MSPTRPRSTAMPSSKNLLLGMVLDKLLQGDEDMVNSEGVEIICRRMHGLQLAFQNVHRMSDWKQPRGSAANKWKSKVRWDLANELDWRAVLDGEEALPGVEKDMTARPQQKALFRKYLLEGGTEEKEDED